MPAPTWRYSSYCISARNRLIYPGQQSSRCCCQSCADNGKGANLQYLSCLALAELGSEWAEYDSGDELGKPVGSKYVAPVGRSPDGSEVGADVGCEEGITVGKEVVSDNG